MNKSIDVAIGAFKTYCQSVGSEYTNVLLKHVTDGNYDAYASSSIDPSVYTDSRAFAADYAAYAYLRKYLNFPSTRDLKAEARVNYEKVDMECHKWNSTFRLNERSPAVEALLFEAQRKISLILGEFSFGKVLQGCDWGSGATSSLTADVATVDIKILEPQLSVTSRCLQYARAYLVHDLHWMMARIGPDCVGPTCPLLSEFLVVDYGRFASVPKSIKSERSIDIQPTLNLFFQKGVGKYIRRKLRINGVDLDDQSRNQDLAKYAIFCGLSTIDLANASDTVSRELVKTLLPYDWYNYLDNIRTHQTKVGSKIMPLGKFSSMGNGFTFELESLIFYALCFAVKRLYGTGDEIISVYGDDIIVTSNLSAVVISTLEHCGFSVNVEKTYTEGPFYESCGKHYFAGREVTPIYQKELISDPPSAIRAANRFISLAARFGEGLFLDWRCRGAYHLIKSHITMRRLPTGPLWLEGDGFLKDPGYKPVLDVHGSFNLQEFRAVPIKRRVLCGAPLLAITLRKGDIAVHKEFVLRIPLNASFGDFVVARGISRYLLQRRRVFLRCVEVPLWASSAL